MNRTVYLSERAVSSDDPLNSFIPGMGNLPQVPYISRVDTNLYVGGVNPTMQLPPWIQYVVSLHPVEYRAAHELDGFAHIKAADHEGQDPEVFVTASIIAREFWGLGPTLIHCAVGLNRSPVTAALAMMEEYGQSSHTVIQILRDKRSPAVLFNRKFEAFVHSKSPHIRSESSQVPDREPADTAPNLFAAGFGREDDPDLDDTSWLSAIFGREKG